MTDDAALIARLEDGDFSNISEVIARLAELARERFSLCEANDMLLSRAEQAEAERDALPKREPTEAMIKLGAHLIAYWQGKATTDIAPIVWRAMYDAARPKP